MEAGSKLFREFVELNGIYDEAGDKILMDASDLAISISEEIGSGDTELAVVKVITGLCLMSIGVDDVVTSWGWQDPDRGLYCYDKKVMNKLTRYVLRNYFEKIKKSYELKKGEIHETTDPSGH